MGDDWDTGAEPESEWQQDKFNKFDPLKAVGGPPSSDEVVKSAEKPEFKPTSFPVSPSCAAAGPFLR